MEDIVFQRKALMNGLMDSPDSVKAVILQNHVNRQPTAKQKTLLLFFLTSQQEGGVHSDEESKERNNVRSGNA